MRGMIEHSKGKLMSLIDSIGMFMPTEEYYNEMPSEDFERFALSELEKQFQQDGVSDYSFEHDKKVNAADGCYQIDGMIKFSAMGADFTVIVECKRYKNAIKREQIQVLYDKLRAIGAQKGIFVTTSYFQSGAISYAKKHGIALISIIDGKLRYEARSKEWISNPVIPPWVEVKPYCMAMQTQMSETSISVSYLDGTDALFKFITQNEEESDK